MTGFRKARQVPRQSHKGVDLVSKKITRVRALWIWSVPLNRDARHKWTIDSNQKKLPGRQLITASLTARSKPMRKGSTSSVGEPIRPDTYTKNDITCTSHFESNSFTPRTERGPLFLTCSQSGNSTSSMLPGSVSGNSVSNAS